MSLLQECHVSVAGMSCLCCRNVMSLLQVSVAGTPLVMLWNVMSLYISSCNQRGLRVELRSVLSLEDEFAEAFIYTVCIFYE